MLVVSLLSLHPDIRGEWWVLSLGEQTDGQIPGSESLMEDLARVWPVFIVGLTVVFSSIYAFLVWTTGKGHNWARWLLLAFILGTEALGLSDYSRSLAETPLALATDICVLAAEIWALWLLFSGTGAAWFKATG